MQAHTLHTGYTLTGTDRQACRSQETSVSVCEAVLGTLLQSSGEKAPSDR